MQYLKCLYNINSPSHKMVISEFGNMLDQVQSNVGQVAQAARLLATGWTARVRSRVSEGWRFFFPPSCPDWSRVQSSSQKMSTGLSPGVKAVKHMTISLQCRGCVYVDSYIHIPRGPSWPLMEMPIPFKYIVIYSRAYIYPEVQGNTIKKFQRRLALNSNSSPVAYVNQQDSSSDPI